MRVSNNLRHGLESHPTKAYGSNDYPQSPEAEIDSHVHRGIVASSGRRVQGVESTHATACRVGTKGTADGRHERERVDKEDGDQSDHHEELREIVRVMGSGALEKLRRQEGYLGVHTFIDGRGEEPRRTGLTASILLGGGGGGGGGG